MQFATLADGSPDGRLLIVSRDHARAVDASAIAPSLLAAVQQWDALKAQLSALSDALNAGHAPHSLWRSLSRKQTRTTPIVKTTPTLKTTPTPTAPHRQTQTKRQRPSRSPPVKRLT